MVQRRGTTVEAIVASLQLLKLPCLGNKSSPRMEPGITASSGGTGLDSDRCVEPRQMEIVSLLTSVDMSSSPTRNDDLKEMLENNKESLKLEAMKRIVGLIAKGKNASELFPAVVKNVASKNIELKKLVYVYLVRYAEEQQDLALLSISTFQRALKDPNQLIRASALRVLSSIRVPIIIPIMMLAIKEAASDMSPYVRKTSAHAIQKLYSLDPDQKEHLIEVIEKLLKDKSTLVAGSVVMAFEEVCPERIDLIHKNYRKLCNLLVDVEEWGQVVIISMLTRYARTQFTSPWREDGVFDENSERAFYESDEEKTRDDTEIKPYTMDPDHRLLLRNTKPLLQSRNTAVVMSVAQLYWHLAPRNEVSIVTKSLVRLLRSHREVQYIVLQNIATMSIQRKGMFEPYMKSFYVRSTDATHIKSLKLEILTNLANEANISTILREFQTYVKSQDKQFAAGTIQAIGRCATNISEVTDTCLNGLVLLLSNRDETVVAESVVVIKKLLQAQPSQHSDIIKHMAKLLDNITVSMARASILWLIGEYCERVPKIAPDVLRKMAKSFTSEEDIVKLQTVNLAAKLYLTNSKQTKLLTQYILNLGKYDQNYDIRDRTRFIRQLIVPNEKSGALSKYARRILLAPKPAPVLESAYKDRDRYQLGTLSHTINTKASGYLELSDWPAVAPDQSVRNVEVIEPVRIHPSICTALFHFCPDSPPSFFHISCYCPSLPVLLPGEGVGSITGEDWESDEDKSSSQSSEESEKSSSQSEKSSSESDIEQKKKKKMKKPPQKKNVKPPNKDRYQSVMCKPNSWVGPGFGACVCVCDFSSCRMNLLRPHLFSRRLSVVISCVSGPAFVPEKSHNLLHRMTGKGLAAQYQFTRQPCLYQPNMVSVQISLTNTSDHRLEQIHIGERSPAGLKIHCFNTIEFLEPDASVTVSMGIDFNDSTQAANFQLCTKEDQFSVSIQPAVGDLFLAVTMTEQDFRKEQGKLQGMNECSATITVTAENTSSQPLNRRVAAMANVGVVPSGQDNVHRFAGKTACSGAVLLVTVELRESSAAVITINTEKSVMGSMLLRDLKKSLAQA
uniref:AP-3 complex subunit beta n=1 Tax=Esox lucius TaxID=8010 RepID=A0A6Q2Z0K2_ESOLU